MMRVAAPSWRTVLARPQQQPTAAQLSWARQMHQVAPRSAKVIPLVGTGPPPPPPVSPAMQEYQSRASRQLRRREMLQEAKEMKKGNKRRFWKDVSVREADGALQVCLDERPLRHPVTKAIVRLPLTKPHLATALALEWDLLTSTQDAQRQHLIPLTSLICRALDLLEEDRRGNGFGPIRQSIVHNMMRYLDTDSLLCWAPEPRDDSQRNADGQSLQDVQRQAAQEVVSYLVGHVWPGVEISPVLDDGSIVPRRQKEETLTVVRGWMSGLSAWELVGLERAILAGKSLLIAARLVCEWSEGPVGLSRPQEAGGEGKYFGVEEAARMASLEVNWQTGQWGEVEDTHDVEKEDLRRQLGSVVLLVSGTGGRDEER